jgi:hypothetical protein
MQLSDHSAMKHTFDVGSIYHISGRKKKKKATDKARQLLGGFDTV